MGNPNGKIPGEGTCSDLDAMFNEELDSEECSYMREFYRDDFNGILSGVCGCKEDEPANLCPLCGPDQELNEMNADKKAPLLDNEDGFTCEFVVNASPFINDEDLCSEAGINESTAAKTFCCKDKESSPDEDSAIALSSILGIFVPLIFTLF